MTDSAASVADRADAYFQQGHNCAQAVLKAVAEVRGLECPGCIPAVALAMGGGIGRTGHACGAVTGAVMVIGLAMDRAARGGLVERKQAACGAAGRFVKAFIAEFGSADCRGILGFDWSEPGAMARAERENAKQVRCTPCVRWAAAEAARVIDEVRAGAP